MKIKILLLSLLLSGCYTPQIKHEEVKINYGNNQYSFYNEADVKLNKQWWLIYNDSKLNDYMSTLYEKNPDLLIAAYNIEKEMLRNNLEGVNNNPNASSNTSANARKQLNDNTPTQKDYSSNFNLSYEVDFFNRLKTKRDIQQLLLEATIEDRESAELVVSNLAVNLYYEYAYLKTVEKINKESIEYYKDLLKIVSVRKEVGKIGLIDVVQAERNLISENNNLLNTENQIAIRLTNIRTVFNDYDMLSYLSDKIDGDVNSAIRTNLPSYVIYNRPDIKALNKRLLSSYKTIEGTVLDYYPRFNLTAGVGYSSLELTSLFKNPVGTLAAALTLPFLNYNERRLNIQISEVDYKIRVEDYKNKIYQGLEEIYTNLENHNTSLKQMDNIKANYDLSYKIVKINRSRYDAGKIGIREYLDSEEQYRQSLISLERNKFDVIKTKSDVYKSLGGS